MWRRGTGEKQFVPLPRHFFYFFSFSYSFNLNCIMAASAHILPNISQRRACCVRRGFSLVESLVSISVLAITGGAIMLSMSAAVNTTESSLDSTVATGIAEQVIDEVMGMRYVAKGIDPKTKDLGPTAWEAAGHGRQRFDDTDDFKNFGSSPVVDTHGFELGQGDGAGKLRHPHFRLPSGYFRGWNQKIDVYYVDETDHAVRLTGDTASDFRAVEVRIFRANDDGTTSTLANLRRVYSYVPQP